MEMKHSLMTQKSLVYMVLAVAVGYILVSAVPQQIAMYTAPQNMLTGPAPDGPLTEGSDVGILGQESAKVPSDDGIRSSMLEPSRVLELMKWWTVDVLVALSIYWVARRRFA